MGNGNSENADVYRNVNEPEPLPFSSSPVSRSPQPVWPSSVNSDYPDFHGQPIDENNLSYFDDLNPAFFKPNTTTDESCNDDDNTNNNNNAANHADENNNNGAEVVECNGENRKNCNGVIRGDDIIVGATDRNDVLDIIDVSEDSDPVENNNNVVEDDEEKIALEMVSELLGHSDSLDGYLQNRNYNNSNNVNNVEENVDRRDKGKAVITAPEEAAVNVISNVMTDDGREGEAGPSGTGRIMFHWVLFGNLDCNPCTVSTGLYSTDDPRFQARISIHGLNGLYHHMVFEIQHADPVFAQEVEKFVFDMHGLPLEKINQDLAFYNIQISQNGEIELQETFLGVYTRICGREFLPPLNRDFMRVGDDGNEVQPVTYDLEAPAPAPLAIDTYTAPQPSMLESPLPDYDNHFQHLLHHQQQYLPNHNSMPYHPNALPQGPNALPQGLPGYLPPSPNQSAAGPSRVNHSIEADPLSFLDHEIPEWMRGASSPEPEEEDDDQYSLSWPTVGIQRERTANMSLLELAPYFHMKAEKASSKLKVCTTTLKIVCRKKGLKRWPYRKIRSMDNKIIGQKRVMKESMGRGDRAAMLEARRNIQKQRDKRIELYKSIFKTMREKQEEEDKNNRGQ